MEQSTAWMKTLESWIDHVDSKDEYEVLSRAAQDLFLDDLFVACLALYTAAIGRTSEEKVTNGLVALILGVYITTYLGLEQMSTAVGEALHGMLSSDSRLHIVQKFFPENKYSLTDLLEFTAHDGLYGGIFRAIALVAGKYDSDLLDHLVSIGEILDGRIITREYERNFEALKGNDISACTYVGILGIRDRVNTYVVLSTLVPLPMVTEDTYKQVAKEIKDYVPRFSVDTAVTEEVQQARDVLLSHLEEVEDIFIDYSQGKKRSESLQSFIQTIPTLFNLR